MKLYRATYAPRGGRLTPRRMTFAADSANDATKIAEDWQLPSDYLLTVKLLRPLVWHLDLDICKPE